MSSADEKYTWHLTSLTTWETPNTHRGYTGDIEYEEGTGYTLTITGSGAPGPSTWDTLRQAKNAYRKYLFTK